jgi:hypothetical protein
MEGRLMQEQFPSFQRLVTFLNNCGFDFFSLRWNWQGWKGYQFYPFTHHSNRGKLPWFREQDEEKLGQLEQASLQGTVFIAEVLGYFRLELDHDRYRLRYAQGAKGRSQLISELLAEKGITEYEAVGIVNEGRDLAVYRNYGMVENCNGTVVTLTKVYNFWLEFVDGHFTLGDTRFYSYNGEERSFWSEADAKDTDPDVKVAKRRLLLRRPAELAEPDGQGRMWEIREEDANQVSQ